VRTLINHLRDHPTTRGFPFGTGASQKDAVAYLLALSGLNSSEVIVPRQ
jgi:hypothetical protein